MLSAKTYLRFDPYPHDTLEVWYARGVVHQYVINELREGVYVVSQFVTGQKEHKRRKTIHGTTYNGAKQIAEQMEAEVKR